MNLRESINLPSSVLQNEATALEIWQQIAASTTNTGGADYFTGIQAAARILTKQQKYEEAIAVPNRVEAAKLGGS